MAQAIAPGRVPAPTRFAGALAVGTVFAPSGTAKQRICTAGMASVALRVKCATVTGTLTVALSPLLSDAESPDSTGTAAAA